MTTHNFKDWADETFALIDDLVANRYEYAYLHDSIFLLPAKTKHSYNFALTKGARFNNKYEYTRRLHGGKKDMFEHQSVFDHKIAEFKTIPMLLAAASSNDIDHWSDEATKAIRTRSHSRAWLKVLSQKTYNAPTHFRQMLLMGFDSERDAMLFKLSSDIKFVAESERLYDVGVFTEGRQREPNKTDRER